jgi:isopentenyl diphosphate isomerase/L-lactate dehydrogenase-like FMN-dependent dehydrogenase
MVATGWGPRPVIRALALPAGDPPPTRYARNVDLDKVFNVSEFERLARDTMEPEAFDFYAGGAWDEQTVSDNLVSWSRYKLLPRMLTGVDEVDLSTSLLGKPVAAPLGLAPTAMHRLAHPGGEVETVRAASDSGTVYCHSTWSNAALEEVAAAGSCPMWLQLYVHKDRHVAEDLVARAEDAGFAAVVLTVDVAQVGYRERDLRNVFSPPPDFGNLGRHPPAEMMRLVAAAHDPSLRWDDLAWLADRTSLPLVLKGILAPEDARLAVEHGAAAVWVSNHGGRQLDRVPTAAEVCEAIVAAVAGGCEVYVDGGVRRGLDVVTAVALGADAAFIGRPFLYALAAAGRSGVARCIELLREEVRLAMCLLGVGSVSDIGPEHVYREGSEARARAE